MEKINYSKKSSKNNLKGESRSKKVRIDVERGGGYAAKENEQLTANTID